MHRRQQQAEESVQSYADHLKQIVANCEFSNLEYQNHIRDVFISGLSDEHMLQKLYEKENLLSLHLMKF